MFVPIGDNIKKSGFPIVTIALIFANVFVLLIQLQGIFTAPSVYALQEQFEFWKQFGLTPSELADGQVLGLVTFMFLHFGVTPLVSNMIFLWVFGPTLEFGLGRWTMLGFYMLFGVASGLVLAASDWESTVTLVGANGAVAGVMGAYMVIYGPMSEIKIFTMFFFRVYIFHVPAVLFGLGWIALQVFHLSGWWEEPSGVAWWAHFGGFAAGVLLGLICRDETEAKLILGKDGKLNLINDEKLEETMRRQQVWEALEAARYHSSLAEADGATATGLEPFTCPYCQATFTEEDKIAESIVKCPNSNCGRMVYLSAELSTPDRLVAIPIEGAFATTSGPSMTHS